MRDILGGLVVLGIGCFFLIVGLDMPLGTARRMGAGYFPVTLSVILIALALLTILGSLRKRTEAPPIAWRSLISAFASIAGFAVAFTWLGLIPAIGVSIGISSLADKRISVFETAKIMAASIILLWAIFGFFLGLPMPAFRGVDLWSIF